MLPKPTKPTEAEMLECIRLLTAVVEDVMPQIGNIVLQDYDQLNRGLILSEKIIGRTKKK